MSDVDVEQQKLELPEERGPLLDVGERLRQAREEKGWELDTVAADLHTDPSKLDALERNEFGAFPSAVFVKGFIRNYARAVEIDPEPLLGSYDRSRGEETVPPLEPVRRVGSGPVVAAALPLERFGRYVVIIVGVVVIGWFGQWLYGFYDKMRQPDSQGAALLPAPGVSLPPPGATDLNNSVTTARPPVSISSRQEPASPAQVPSDLPAAEPEPSSSEATEPAPQPVPIAPAPALAQLTLTFSEDSWVEVTDARDSRLLTRVGKAGDTHSVSGIAPFDVVLGYGPGVTVEYNGEPYDFSAFSRGKVARFTVGSE